MPGSSSALSPAATRVAGAAGAAVRQRLASTGAVGEVVHAGSHAIYARVGGRLVGLVSRGATLTPSAVRTTLPRLPDAAPGDPASIGDGELRVAGLAVTVARVVPTEAPALPDPEAAVRLLEEALLGTATADLAPARSQLPEPALARLREGDPAAVPLLLGLGDGLTPVGDDVVAGWLVAARSAGRPVEDVAAAVTEHAPRTTPLSASLLSDAAAGECLPEVRALLLALRAGTGIEPAVTALAAVGHTSGRGMLLGVRLALAGVERRGEPR